MKNLRSILVTTAAVAAAAVGGAAIATAATSSTTSTTTSASSSAQTAPANQGARPNMPAHGSAAHEDAEKPVTGVDASKAQAAAVKAAGGGTAGAVTTDFTGHGYEVTVKKSDGSSIELHLDSSFTVQDHGGPGGPGGPGVPGA